MTSARHEFKVEIAPEHHHRVMINVKERNLIVLLPQDKKHGVEKVQDFYQVVHVRIQKNLQPWLCVVIKWRWYAKQVQVLGRGEGKHYLSN